MRARARCLTLMPSQPLTRLLAGTGTPSLVYGFPSRRAFRYPAHAAGVAGCRKFFVLSSRLGWRMILGAGSGNKPRRWRDSTGKKMDRFVTRAREGGRSQTGEAPAVVSAASFRSVSAPNGLPLRETVRPHSEITGNGLTPRPSDYAPGCVAPRVALAALRPALRRLVGESA
jgi:hypothetical protein